MRKYYISNRRDEQTCEWPQITLGLYISLQCLLSLGKNAVLFILSFIGENKDSWVIVLVKALLWLTLFSLFKIVKPHQIQGSTLKKNLLHIELGRARVVSHWPQKKMSAIEIYSAFKGKFLGNDLTFTRWFPTRAKAYIE